MSVYGVKFETAWERELYEERNKLRAERDAALQACAAMRELLRRALPSVQFASLLGLVDEVNKALAAPDAGRGYVSPEAQDKQLREVAEKVRASASDVAVTIETVWSQKEPKNSHPDSARQIRQLALVAYDVGHRIRDLNLAAIIAEVKGRET